MFLLIAYFILSVDNQEFTDFTKIIIPNYIKVFCLKKIIFLVF